MLPSARSSPSLLAPLGPARATHSAEWDSPRSLSNLFPLSQRQTTRTHSFSRVVAEAERFERSMPCGMPPFQGGALDHYATPPCMASIADFYPSSIGNMVH